MAKRFIGTDIFDDEWFSSLSQDAMLGWVYLITNCDHAGIYKPNARLFEFQAKVKSYDTVIKELAKSYVTLKNGYLFLPGFIRFQYSNGLNPNAKVHQSVISILNKYEIELELLPNSYLTVKVINKNKDEAMDKAITTPKPQIPISKPTPESNDTIEIPTLEAVKERFKNAGEPDDTEAVKFFNHYESMGWRKSGNVIYKWVALVKSWQDNARKFRTSNPINSDPEPGTIVEENGKRTLYTGKVPPK